MTVTVVVSGLPKRVPLSDLARNFDMIFDTNEVGTFRLREISHDSSKRLVALDFKNGFDAMDVQCMLDGFEFNLNDDIYTLKSKISNDPKYLPETDFDEIDIPETHSDRRHSKDYEYSNSLVPFNKRELQKQNSKLNAHLLLLKKKKMVVEAERELLRAKRKLKREYTKDDTDSDSEDEKCHKCTKSSKHRKKRSKSRDEKYSHKHSSKYSPVSDKAITLYEMSPPPSYRHESSKSRRSKSRVKMSPSRVRMSPSRVRRSPSRSRRSPSRVRRSPSRVRRSKSRDIRSQSRPRRSQSRSRRSESRSRRSSSRYRRSPPRITEIYETKQTYNDWIDSPSTSRRSPHRTRSPYREVYIESKRMQYITKLSPTKRSRRSPDYTPYVPAKESPSSSSYYRESPYHPTRPRDISSCYSPSNATRPVEQIYFNRKPDKQPTVTEELYSSSKDCAKKIEEAVQSVITEINNMVQNEKDLLSDTDKEIVNNEFKNYVKNEFQKLKSKFYEDMSTKDIVKYYRRGRTRDEDKNFILKLIGELKPVITNNVEKNNIEILEKAVPPEVKEVKPDNNNTKAKNDNSTKRRRSTEMWDDVQAVLEEMPIEILQESDDGNRESDASNETNRINININCTIKRLESTKTPKHNGSNILSPAENRDAKKIEIIDLVEETSKESKGNETNSRTEVTSNNHLAEIQVPKDHNKSESINEQISKNKKTDNLQHKDLEVVETIDGSDKEADISNKSNEKNETSQDNNNAKIVNDARLEIVYQQFLESIEESVEVPKKPLFIIPIKKIMGQMKSHLVNLSSTCKDLHSVTQVILRDTLYEMLKGKDMMKTAAIVDLYRSSYPKENDASFLKEIVENVNNGKLAYLNINK